MHQISDFILTDESEAVETGDHVTLVDKNGKESPVMVRILRAVTPRTFSARLARSRWKRSPTTSADENSGVGPSPPRIFEIVREQQLSASVSLSEKARAKIPTFNSERPY